MQELLYGPESYNVLNRNEYPQAYAYLEKISTKIRQSGKLRYANDFEWDIYIIDENVLNAFALPGGPTFFYTGLLKYLDDEASLAGVMGHEMAHVDRRHSTNRMTKAYGLQVLLSMLLGEDPSLTAQIAAELAAGAAMLAYSRDDEYEADEYAVKYLYETDYDARGVAYFFEKMEVQKEAKWMIYFSTHPHPHDRIDKVYKLHNKLGGKVGQKFTSEYEEFKKTLP